MKESGSPRLGSPQPACLGAGSPKHGAASNRINCGVECVATHPETSRPSQISKTGWGNAGSKVTLPGQHNISDSSSQ